jgi:hypothetical protein
MGRGNKRVSLSIVLSAKIHLTVNRDEEAVVEDVKVEEGEAVGAGVVAGKTIESASKRSRNTTRNSKDTITVFWDWQMRRRGTTSGLH